LEIETPATLLAAERGIVSLLYLLEDRPFHAGPYASVNCHAPSRSVSQNGGKFAAGDFFPAF
jgi:hypothetical protein